MPTAQDVGKKIAELCRQNKHMEAIDACYHPKIISVEPFAPPGKSARCEGIAAVKEKGQWWLSNHEIHSQKVEGPFPHGDRFAIRFSYDVTAKGGPMAGKRFQMDEIGLYTVSDGKITQEEFFYSMG